MLVKFNTQVKIIFHEKIWLLSHHHSTKALIEDLHAETFLSGVL